MPDSLAEKQQIEKLAAAAHLTVLCLPSAISPSTFLGANMAVSS
jgi:hypothetical protein